MVVKLRHSDEAVKGQIIQQKSGLLKHFWEVKIVDTIYTHIMTLNGLVSFSMNLVYFEMARKAVSVTGYRQHSAHLVTADINLPTHVSLTDSRRLARCVVSDSVFCYVWLGSLPLFPGMCLGQVMSHNGNYIQQIPGV